MSAYRAVSVMTCSKTTVNRSSRSSPRNPALIGRRDGRIVVVDEQHFHGPIAVLERASELVHVDHTRRRLFAADPGSRDPPRRGIAHRIAAAAHAEFPGHCGQSENGERCAAAVALRSCPQPHRMIGTGGPALCRGAKRAASMPASCAARSKVQVRAFAKTIGPARVRREE